jgi:hypothetical protein
MTFALAGVLLGLGGHWPVAYGVFAIGGVLAAIGGMLVWRREKQAER